MHRILLWKRLCLWGVCALCLWLALPNAFYTRVEASHDAQTQSQIWPGWLPDDLVNLGLDLRGGAHLLARWT